MAALLLTGFAAVLVYANQNLLDDTLIAHVQYHRSILLPYPWNWDFHVPRW